MPAQKPRLPHLATFVLLALSSFINYRTAAAQEEHAGPKPRDLDTPRDFPNISSAQEWTARAKYIREHVLVSCGLWPLPPRAPLDRHIFGKIERGDYSIEKVYIQTYPGFYLAGNLYRPLGKGKGPFPAVLNPHGHWSNGRMADEKDGSIAGRCISFARMGMIAFSYDMVGYNDTHFADPPSTNAQYNIHRQFGTDHADLLWNISLMGLQTWNSIRALDFLQSLPDADPKRLACTGESGGGTQTFILGATDDRLALQAPIVMVSHIMQGGCLCENAPGLRVQFSNMEIAAAPAPRPQILVAATGDWTRDTLSVEGPAIAHIYQLLGAPEKFHYDRFDFPHNYNQTTREAVYGWFNKWLLHASTYAALKEQPYQKEPDSELRVFPHGRLPAGAMTKDAFISSLKRLHQAQLQQLAPHDNASLRRFKEWMLPAWRHTLQLEPNLDAGRIEETQSETGAAKGTLTTSIVRVSREGDAAPIICTHWEPRASSGHGSSRLVILSDSNLAIADQANNATALPTGLALELLNRGISVLQVSRFSTVEPADQFSSFYCTYNRTALQSRVRDLVTLCYAAKMLPSHTRSRVTLVGSGDAGLWSLMAAPAADSVIADCSNLDNHDEQALLGPDIFCPGMLALGGFETAAALALPNPLLLHNTGSNFHSIAIRNAYSETKNSKSFKTEHASLSASEIVDWLAK